MGSKQYKWESPSNLAYLITLGTKFNLKQTILIFGPNLPKSSTFGPD